MHIYRLEAGAESHRHFATMAEAHAEARLVTWRPEEVFIDLLDVQIDKEGTVALMNHEPIVRKLRSWQLTPRKGLKELKED